MNMRCSIPDCDAIIHRHQPYFTFNPSAFCDVDQKLDLCVACTEQRLNDIQQDPNLSLHQFVSRKILVTELNEVHRLLVEVYGYSACDVLPETFVWLYPTECIIMWESKAQEGYLQIGNAQYTSVNAAQFEDMEIELYKWYLSERCGILDAYEMEF